MRLVQQARKDAELHVRFRLSVTIEPGPETAQELMVCEAYVKETVLATTFTFGIVPHGAFVAEGKVGYWAGAAVKFAIAKR